MPSGKVSEPSRNTPADVTNSEGRDARSNSEGDGSRRWGRTVASPEREWYLRWIDVRDRLRLTHAVSAALTRGGGVDDALRDLGRPVPVEGGGDRSRGISEFVRMIAALRRLTPVLPVRGEDEDALVRFLWWCSACLGMTRSDLVKVVADSQGVVGARARSCSAPMLDRLMWRSGPPPVRGGGPAGLERIAGALNASEDAGPASFSLREAWAPLAVERCRLIEPGVLALVAMLADLAAEPFNLFPLVDRHLRLAPVALTAACSTTVSIRRTTQEAVGLDLLIGDAAALELNPAIRAAVIHSLTPAERQCGAQAAVAAMERHRVQHAAIRGAVKEAARSRQR